MVPDPLSAGFTVNPALHVMLYANPVYPPLVGDTSNAFGMELSPTQLLTAKITKKTFSDKNAIMPVASIS